MVPVACDRPFDAGNPVSNVPRAAKSQVPGGRVRGVLGAGGNPVTVAIGDVAKVGTALHDAGLAIRWAGRVIERPGMR